MVLQLTARAGRSSLFWAACAGQAMIALFGQRLSLLANRDSLGWPMPQHT